MNIKDVRKVAGIMDAIKAVDTEINQIEKIAMSCKDGVEGASVILSITPKSKNKHEFINVLDSDGSIKNEFKGGTLPPETNRVDISDIWKKMYGIGGPVFFNHYEEPKQSPSFNKTNHEQHNFSLDDVSILYLLEVLIHDKKQKRYKLIAEIKEMGVVL